MEENLNSTVGLPIFIWDSKCSLQTYHKWENPRDWLIHSFIDSFIRSFIHPTVYFFIRLFIYSFILWTEWVVNEIIFVQEYIYINKFSSTAESLTRGVRVGRLWSGKWL